MSDTVSIPNLLLVAGTGTKSGKTSLACRIISQFSHLEINAIKITPHFHETTPGLISICEGDGYSVSMETDAESNKDTSRMLRAGAHRVFLAKVWDNKLPEVFARILEQIPEGEPVICESPALREFAEPGIFIIMSSNNPDKKKNISHLQKLPHVSIELEDLEEMTEVPVNFSEGRWRYRE